MNLLQSYETENINNLQKSAELFCSCRFKGSSGSETKTPTTSKDQQAVGADLSEFLRSGLEQGATPYTGQLTADVPDLVGGAYAQFEDSLGRSLTPEERTSLSSLATGSPVEAGGPGDSQNFFNAETAGPDQFLSASSDPEQVIQDWRENFANPLTSYYNEFVKPTVREEFNVPGGFNTSERAEGVSRAFNEFYGGSVAPSLFSAQQAAQNRSLQERSQLSSQAASNLAQRNALNFQTGSQVSSQNFAGRSQGSAQNFQAGINAQNLQLPALQYLQNLPSQQLGQAFQGAAGYQSFQQPEISARYNEFLRGAIENNPYVQLAAGFATSPTEDTIVRQGGGPNYGALLGAGIGAIGAGTVTGGLGAGQGALVGASIGSQAGF